MKKYLILVLIVLVTSALFIGVLAEKPGNVPHGPAGASNIAHAYLYEKDPVTWEIVENGAWGKMTYNQSGSTFDFVFNGHGLEVGGDYTLIYYHSWSVVICLGSGTADEYGDVHIGGSENTGDLTDAKIWLVLSANVNCGECKMSVWNPPKWLFEYDLITFDDTD